MKSEMKKYEKPTIEVVDVQWNEAIAGSGARITVDVDTTPSQDTNIWFGQAESTWNTRGF
ncbi:hypothetical protein LJC57_07440 [Parabacteroides sp. OttesenSCG-928-G07]|nr:hypothetical protein [Parabacteroides sp. OttesenSCG-928-G21]MDL2278409.1 hypothetical protein [Parabacteroides sp. OttesenSCG-928-G07]